MSQKDPDCLTGGDRDTGENFLQVSYLTLSLCHCIEGRGMKGLVPGPTAQKLGGWDWLLKYRCLFNSQAICRDQQRTQDIGERFVPLEFSETDQPKSQGVGRYPGTHFPRGHSRALFPLCSTHGGHSFAHQCNIQQICACKYIFPN